MLLGLEQTRGHVIRSKKYKTTIRADSTEENRNEESEVTAATEDILSEIGLSARLLVTEPTVFFFMLWCAFSFGLIFISTESVAQVYTTAFAFKGYQAGLVQASMFVGEVIGLVACFLSNQYYARSATAGVRSDNFVVHEPMEQKDGNQEQRADDNSNPQEGLGKPIQETALHLSIPATILFLSSGLFVYAWTSYASFPWIAPAIGLAMQGCAIQIIVTAVTIYMTDSYERYAASAIAGIAFGENMFAAFLPLGCLPLYLRLGYQWASGLLAFLALALAGAPIVLPLKGPSIRPKSKAIKDMAWS